MNDKNLDAKSILGLSMTLLSATSYKLEIHGTDEAEAKAAMVEVFNKHNLILERLKGLKERSKRVLTSPDMSVKSMMALLS